jgi:hypothetical protein
MVISFPNMQCCAILAGAAAVVLFASPAWPTEYFCEVPRALLCDGCASHIAIALQPGGACRISFSSASVNLQTPSRESERVEFQVQAPQPVQRHISFRRQQTAVFAKPSSSRRCFVFNAAEYCE